ncbi:MAG: TolC family protein, partial [Gemmataceae bacterium]
SERILALSEDRARRELADATFFDRAMPEEESEKRVSKERTFLIKLDQAVELGLINSREYQTRREQVYLAALPVTLERFAFFPQVYGAGQVIRERINPQGPIPSQRFWTGNGEAGLTQLFPNGALLLLSFANRTVLNLTRSPDVAFSNISLDVVQPLLLGAGIAVNLEPLTQAERTLLYAIRDFAKFRQDFYVYLAGGQPNIPGIFTDTIRLNQDTVAVPDRFVPPAIGVPIPFGASFIRPQVTPGQGGRFPEIFTGDAPAQGYLSTLAEKAQLINQYRNIVALRRFLQLFRVYLEGGIVSSVQVNQVEQSLLRAIEDCLRQQANYRISLDQFKLQLGLPMPLRIEVEDTPLRPMLDQTRRYENISGDYERLSIEAQAFDNPEEADRLRGRLQKMLTESRLIRGTRIKQNLGKKIEEWAGVSTNEKAGGRSPFDQKLEPLYREREVLLNRRKELRKRLESDLSEEEAKKLQQVEFEIDLAEYERALRAYEQKEWKDAKDPMEAQRRLFGTVYQRFLSLLEEPYRERQEPVRRLWPSLPQVCVNGVDLLSDDDDVVLASISQAALTNRLDLMNRRAQLVDSWRKIRIAANRLLGTFNVQYHVDGAYSFGTPELFNIGQVRRQAIIDTELPIVRIQQRNEYRATLITYQRQRRELQKSEDRILYEARSQLRQLRVTAYNYQNIQKRAVELAYNQVDQALQAFSQPQQPTGPVVFQGLVGPPAAGGGSGDPAALTQQLLSAQNSLLQAQNALYNTWIAYLIGRMSLYREMGIMILDPRGVWIDDVAQCQCRPTQTPDSKPGDGKQEPKPGDAPPRAPDLPAPRPLVLPDLKTTN